MFSVKLEYFVHFKSGLLEGPFKFNVRECGTEVEDSSQNPEVEGSYPAIDTGRENMAKSFLNIHHEHYINYVKMTTGHAKFVKIT
jgi:hypothetical protein